MTTVKKMVVRAGFAAATVVLLSVPALTGQARAVETAYTSGAGNFPGGDTSAWTDVRNWSNGVPGPTDIASIGGEIYGRSTNVPQGVVLAGLNVGVNATLLGGSITVTGASNWTGGDIRSALTIPPGVTLNIAGAADKTLFDDSLLNQGTVMWSGTGTVQATSTAKITNSGLIEARSDAALGRLGSGPSPVFTNTGILRKSAGAGATRLNLALVNSGTFDARVGTLLLRSDVNDKFSFGPGSVFAGAGTTRCEMGDLNLKGAFLVPGKLELGGQGNLTGNGTLARGRFRWTGGRINGSLTVAPGTTMDIAGSEPKTLFTGGLLNRGTILWSGTGPIQGFSATTITNSGLFEARSDAVIERAASGPSPVFTNTGTFRKSAGVGIKRLDMTLRNGGTFDIRAGVLQMYSISGSTFSFSTGSIFSGAGTTRCDGGQVLASGVIAIPGKLELSGFATLTGSATFNGTFLNRAIVRPTLLATFNGSYVQPSPGVLQLRVRGAAPSQHDRVVVNGRVVLGGELRIAEGVSLAPGSTIVIIQNDGVDAIGGTFTGFREGSIVYVAGTPARLSYRGGSGNDVTLSVPRSTSGA